MERNPMKEYDFQRILQICREHLIVMIIIATFTTACVAVYTFFFAPRVYNSISTLMITKTTYYYNVNGQVFTQDELKKIIAETGVDPTKSNPANISTSDIEKWVSTYATAIKSGNVLSRLAEDLGYPVDASQINLAQLNDTQFVNLETTADSPEKAQQINQKIIPIFKEYIRNLLKVENMEVVEEPSLNPDYVSPNVKKNLLIGLIAGMALAAAYAFLRDLYDNRVRTVEDIKAITGVTVVAVIPKSKELNDGESNARRRSGKRRKHHE